MSGIQQSAPSNVSWTAKSATTGPCFQISSKFEVKPQIKLFFALGLSEQQVIRGKSGSLLQEVKTIWLIMKRDNMLLSAFVYVC